MPLVGVIVGGDGSGTITDARGHHPVIDGIGCGASSLRVDGGNCVGLRSDWLNDGVKRFFYETPPQELILDVADTQALLRHLGL